MSGRNPSSSIRSASSSTAKATSDSFSSPRPIRSITRPGVPTTTCAPRLILSTCGPIGRPPTITTVFTRPPESFFISWETCSASSRVGARIRPWMTRRSRSSFSSIGSVKAAVLPVPVRAWPLQSRPASASGRNAAWILLGRSNPISSSVSRVSSLSPRSAKVGPSSSAASSSFDRRRLAAGLRSGAASGPRFSMSGVFSRRRDEDEEEERRAVAREVRGMVGGIGPRRRVPGRPWKAGDRSAGRVPGCGSGVWNATGRSRQG